MTLGQLHKAQAQILYTLRRSPASRYTDLMRPTGMESDTFKFHLRNLVKSELVRKDESGMYLLTPAGKEFANNLDKAERHEQKQPKLSVLIAASRTNDLGKMEYLLQQRRRNPYWGYWGFISGPVRWGESFEEAAARELAKQTGLSGNLQVKGFYRKRDFDKDTGTMLEDKLFALLAAHDIEGSMPDTWGGGHNEWMTLSELQGQETYFSDTVSVITQLSKHKSYSTDDTYYDIHDY